MHLNFVFYDWFFLYYINALLCVFLLNHTKILHPDGITNLDSRIVSLVCRKCVMATLKKHKISEKTFLIDLTVEIFDNLLANCFFPGSKSRICLFCGQYGKQVVWVNGHVLQRLSLYQAWSGFFKKYPCGPCSIKIWTS